MSPTMIRRSSQCAAIHAKHGRVPPDVEFFGLAAFDVTQNYDAAHGNRLVVDFDAQNGVARKEKVTITLRDDTPTGPKTYALLWSVDLEPLYNITFSALRFIAIEPCDLLGNADPDIRWIDSQGGSHEVKLDGNAGVITRGFASRWQEVGISRGLTVPDPIWHEADPVEFGAPPAIGPPVLPGVSHHVQSVVDGGDCDGRFEFDVTLSLRFFERL